MHWTSRPAHVSTLVTCGTLRIVGTINGTEVIRLDDDTFAVGEVGYYAASSRSATTAHTHVRFDNVAILALPASGADAVSMTPH